MGLISTAAISAINGYVSDPTKIDFEKSVLPEKYLIDDSMILGFDYDINKPIIKGPNIKSVPIGKPISEIYKKVMIKVGDNITTDHIVPGGAKVLPYRSNIEKISEFTFSQIDEGFYDRCKENDGGIIIAVCYAGHCGNGGN